MQRNRYRHCLFFGLVACTLTAPTFGQSANAGTRTPLAWQDSVVTQLVTTTLLARLAGDIADAALRDTVRAWVIEVPADAGALRWSQIAPALRRTLNARDRLPPDRAYLVLHVRDVLYTRDSLVVTFFIGGQRACGAKFTGGGTEYRAATALSPHPSPYVPIVSEAVDFSNSGACRSP